MKSSPNKEEQKLASALARLKRLSLTEAFDGTKPESRPTPTQLEVLRDMQKVPYRYVRGGNQSGKSQLGARETAWVLTETHPYWKRPEEWGDQPLLLLVVARVSRQAEEVLWRKIKAFLQPGSYREIRQGGSLQKVEFLENGNSIVFLSHHADNEAREKLQGYVAHYAWLDEMPGSLAIFEEIQRRVQSNRGYFLATFTPKTRNESIRKMIDSACLPYSKVYVPKMFDNPVLADDDKAKVLASLATQSESMRNTILEGNWYSGENAVFSFDYDSFVRLPEGYSPSWRHVESVDPALSSKLGYVLLAQDPVSGTWYVIKAEYVEGIKDPQALVEKVRSMTGNVNVVRRVSDPHEVWYIQTAARLGLSYMGVWDKTSRKGELIKNTQTAISSGRVRAAPWCVDLLDELSSAQWSEKGENKIINASSYHQIDALEYAVDNLPREEFKPHFNDWHTELRAGNEKRKKQENARMKIQKNAWGIRAPRKTWNLNRKA